MSCMSKNAGCQFTPLVPVHRQIGEAFLKHHKASGASVEM